jgi:uncharacterized protein involved in exopolysaccharide biosynthesis
LSKRDIFIFLFKWKYSLIGYFLFIVTLTTVLVYVLPQKYLSTAVILVEGYRAPVMNSIYTPGTDELSVINSEAEIILSYAVLSSAVDSLGSLDSGEPPTALQEFVAAVKDTLVELGLSEDFTPREELIDTLTDELDVEPLASSSIIEISYKSKYPVFGAKIVNAVTDSYMDHHLKIYASPGTSEMYRLQAKRLNSDLSQKRKELEDYKRKASVVAVEENIRTLVQEKADLKSQLAATKEELAALLDRYDSKHHKVINQQKKIERITDTLNETQEQLLDLEEQNEQLDKMNLAINIAEEAVRKNQEQYENARLNEPANTDVSNVRLVEYATVAAHPEYSRLFYIALAVIGGFMLTFIIALIREYFDHRVTDTSEAEELLGIPVLGYLERA